MTRQIGRLLAVASTLFVTRVGAQQPRPTGALCRAAASAQADLGSSSRATSELSARVEALVWAYSVRSRFLPTAGPLPDSLVAETQAISALAAADSNLATAIAGLLGSMMRNTWAYSSLHASVGAVLYDTWRLPAGSARAVLRDRDASAFARWHALRALQNRAENSWLRDDLFLVLCDLAAVAGGRQVLWGDVPSAGAYGLGGYLDTDERALALRVGEILIGDTASRALPQLLTNEFGSGNPVTQYVERLWRLLGR